MELGFNHRKEKIVPLLCIVCYYFRMSEKMLKSWKVNNEIVSGMDNNNKACSTLSKRRDKQGAARIFRKFQYWTFWFTADLIQI
jgi:hypothetical protein